MLLNVVLGNRIWFHPMWIHEKANVRETDTTVVEMHKYLWQPHVDCELIVEAKKSLASPRLPSE